MTLTIYFDGQFWVGVAQRLEAGQLSVARHVFGVEPYPEEVLAFIQYDLFGLLDQVSGSLKMMQSELSVKTNPKRLKRLVERAQQRKQLSTASQDALRVALEANKKVRREQNQADKLANEQRRYVLARQKAKQKHKGH